MFNIVLHEPEIPGNTENIGRTCVCTGTKLHLIEPLGFRLDKKNTRAGLDYWERVDYERYMNFVYFIYKNGLEGGVKLPEEYIKKNEFIIEEIGRACGINRTPSEINAATVYFLTTKGHRAYSDVEFHDGDYLVFGKESAGIPEEILSLNEDKCIRIPMIKEERSLNLSNSVNIVLYEALRQNNFLDLEKIGELHRLKYN